MNRHLGRSRKSIGVSAWECVAAAVLIPVYLIAGALLLAWGLSVLRTATAVSPGYQSPAVQSWPLPPGTIRSV